MAESESTSESASDVDDGMTPVEIKRDESMLARRVVRPPRVWVGIGTALVGMIVIGVALVTPVQWVAVVGVVIVIAGGAFAWWNGVLADAHGGGMETTDGEALPDDAHVGMLPSDRLHDERAVTDAARAEAAAASVEREVSPSPSPVEWGRAAAGVLAIGAAWLVLTLPTFALEPENHDPGLRQAAAAIVIALAAIRMVVTGPSLRWALAAAIAATLLLISLALWWPELTGPRVAGLVGGMVALGAAASVIIALKSRRTTS